MNTVLFLRPKNPTTTIIITTTKKTKNTRKKKKATRKRNLIDVTAEEKEVKSIPCDVLLSTQNFREKNLRK